MTTLYATGFEDALIGVGYQFNTQLAVYDWDRCIAILMERDHMDYDEGSTVCSSAGCSAESVGMGVGVGVGMGVGEGVWV